MTAHGPHHGSRRWMVPLLATTLAATVGCTSAASPTPSGPAGGPGSAPPIASPGAVPSLAPSAVPSLLPSPSAAPVASPSANPSSSALPTVGRAPSGAWKTVGWLDGGTAFPLTAPAGSETFLLDVYGWSGGYVAFAADAGSSGDASKSSTLQTTSSTDGIHWSTPRAIDVKGLGNEVEIVGLAESPGGLVAIGEFPPGTCGGPDIYAGFWHSTDGTTWTRVQQPPAMAAAAISSLNGGPSGFIATGSRNEAPVIWLSSDGAAWKPGAPPKVAKGKVVIDQGFSVPGGLVVSGAIVGPPGCGGNSEIHPAVWWSADGTTWTQEALSGAPSGSDVTLWVRRLADGGLVATETGADDSPQHVWATADGKTWTAASGTPNGLGFDVMTDGRHAIIPEQDPDNNGPWTIHAVADDLSATVLEQTGAIPSEADDGPVFIFAVGPTGLVAVATDGSAIRLGVPGA